MIAQGEQKGTSEGFLSMIILMMATWTTEVLTTMQNEVLSIEQCFIILQ